MEAVRAKRVLVVEDEPIVALATEQVLQNAGYSTSSAQPGEEALKAVREDLHIDLVLMDIDLGSGIDGAEKAELILNVRPLPVVFLSSHSEKHVVHRAKTVANYGYVLKGSGDFVLLQTIENAIHLFETQQALAESERRLRLSAERGGVVFAHTDADLRYTWSANPPDFDADKYRFLVKNAGDTIIQLNRDLNPVYLSPSVTRQTGYTVEDYNTDTSVFEPIHADDRVRVQKELEELIGQRAVRGISTYRIVTKEGEVRWKETTARLFYDAAGAFDGLVASERDVTERKKDEDRLQKIIDNSPLFINEVDVSGHYLLVNEATCRLLETTKEELVGKHFEEVLPSETASVFKERVEKVSETGEQMTVDDTLHIDRQERVFRTVLFPVYRHGESLPSVIGMGYEMTEEIRLHKEKDLLMKELNHRVKNDLNMVSSLINLKAEETEADLSDIKRQIKAISLIHEKLHQTESVTEIGCRDYFDDLLSSIFSSFAARQVRIEKDIDDIRIPTKPAMSLGLVINEIATNAIEHGFSDGEEAVFFIRMKEDRNNSRYEVTLSNTGKPFPEDIDFDNPQTLGLRLIWALTAQLDGAVDLQRAPHPVFTIRFPMAEQASGNGSLHRHEQPEMGTG